MGMLLQQVSPVFDWLCRTTVQASWIIVLILLVQFVARGRLGARWHYCLWLLLIVRMVMPLAPASRVSLFNLVPHSLAALRADAVPDDSDKPEATAPVDFIGHSLTSVEPDSVPDNPDQPGPTLREDHAAAGQLVPRATASTTGPPSETASNPPAVRQSDTGPPSRLVSGLPAAVWLVGAAVLAGYVLVVNFGLWRAVKRERPVTDESVLDLLEDCKAEMGVQTIVGVLVSSRAQSPALFGFLRPRLLLPRGVIAQLSRDELRHVFLHELAHLKRGDLYLGWLVAFLQVLHWFNPLVWFAFGRMRAARELACDQLVMSVMKGDEPQQYGRTIISLLDRFSRMRYAPALAGIIERKSQLKERMTMIASFGKHTHRGSVLGPVLILLLAGTALTDARDRSAAGETMVTTGFPVELNDDQRLYMEWTEAFFLRFLDQGGYLELPEDKVAAWEKEWLNTLESAHNQRYYQAINALARIESNKAVQPLLRIASERREKDNRDRWMAVRALGLLGDKSVVPELIHLIYHYNQNTRFWAQISLVRLTGANFGSDWKAWGQWRSSQNQEPPFLAEKVEWITNPKRIQWADPQYQKTQDREFIDGLKAKLEQEGAATSDPSGKAPILPADKKLDNLQRFYLDWTEEFFAAHLHQDQHRNIAGTEKDQLEEAWLAALESRRRRSDYYRAINCLATIGSERAVKPLLRIAAERREKDNRDRWMAVRALGLLGDKSVVPELIHLIYHYNQNTRFWAQISLVRLTDQNFGHDWKAWGQWWAEQGGQPGFSEAQVIWTRNPKLARYADPEQQIEMDAKVMDALPKPQAKETTPRAAAFNDEGKLVIPSQAAWTDTGIEVTKGQRITISATGLVHGCRGPENDWAYGPFSPEGMIRQGAVGEWAGRRMLYLRARIGSKEIRVGKHVAFKAEESGRLHLGTFDPYYADNLGSFLVEVLVDGKRRPPTTATGRD